MNRPRVRSALLPALVVTAAFAGCDVSPAPKTTSSRPEAASHASLDTRPFERWYEVWVSTTSLSGDSSRRMVGYVAHAFTKEDPIGRHYVHDLGSERIGYVTPKNIAYRFTRDVNGELTTVEVTHAPLGDAVAAVLGVYGQVELREIERQIPAS